ncbi:hypothetical protein Q5I06_01355 [Helicobacter sp. faydin-H76]|uniref:Rod binding protein n=2 Tax=Helicobacter cappadocius TaxID=3063998 RepID=A0AA90T4L0_9HELI|nr:MULTISPECIES: hypothetical protein [unclassified Helicobacter]MDO7252566.1 hypothetical protein [Helicobacter sp. faydin-H75]MDP2538433.1 hypothetical protein [Helicobacter sp. faydin-H76]
MMKLDVNSIYSNYQTDKVLKQSDLKGDDKKLKKQTDEFEALILKFFLDTSLKLDNPLYPKEAGTEIYQAMYKENLSKELSGSFGYSELLFNFLKEQEVGKR